MSYAEGAHRPRVFYGWVLVGVLGVTEATSWGILFYGFSVFLEPMRVDMGWSRADASGAFSLALLVSGVAAVPVGRWLDRRGPRLAMTAGSILGTGLVVAWSAVNGLPALCLVWACIGLAMAATLYEPAFATLARWFHRRRARAFLVLTLMAGLASTIFQPLAAWLIGAQGWRGALLTLAVVLALVAVPAHALLLRRGPESMGLAPDGDPRSAEPVPEPGHSAGIPLRVLARDTAFWWLVAIYLLNTFGQIALSVHLVPYLGDRGASLQDAAVASGAVGAMQLVGRILFTPLETRAPRLAVVSVFLAQPLSVVILLLVPGTAGIWGFVALYGAGRGAATLARAQMVAAAYGPARFGSANGALSFFTTIAQSAGPIVAGAGFDLAGTYEPVFWAIAGISFVAALCAARVKAT